jgi:hypothetical protein
MRYRLLIFTLLLMLVSSAAAAQEAETWFWAWKPEARELVAYTATGDVNTLLDYNFEDTQVNAWRLSEDSALAVLTSGGARQLYRLTSTEAELTTFPEPNPSMGDTPWALIAQQGDYAVLVDAVEYPSGVGLMVNTATNTAAPLDWEMNFLRQRAGFSADGNYFRYLGRNPEDDYNWTIRERKLETGAERVIYTFTDEFFPTVSTDTHGNQWVYVQRGVTSFIPVNGEPTTLLDETLQSRWYVGESMVTFSPLCESDCTLVLEAPDEPPQTYSLPPSSSGNFVDPIQRIDESHLLILLDEQFWLLGTDGTTQALGAHSPRYLVQPREKLLSPDNRYLLTMTSLDDDPSYQVLDLQTGEAVIESSPDREFRILQNLYRAGGFILTEDVLHFQFYRYSDGQVFDLGKPGAVYFDALADGTLLFSQVRANETRERGIYRYNPDDATYTLAVEGAVPINVQ